MYTPQNCKIWLANADNTPLYLDPSMACRHGSITGATGTGKTVTLKVLAEAFSEMGTPVFLADIKGDVSGTCLPGVVTKHIQRSMDTMGLEEKGYAFQGFPVRFFDVYGTSGHPVRTTIARMGAMLLSRLMNLNDTQAGVLNIVFRVAEEKGWDLIDIKDLRAMLQYVSDHAAEYKTVYGNVSAASVGAIQRAILALEDQGGDRFFGEPALDIKDWMATDDNGRGIINILECDELFQHPLLYSTFMLWMLNELYSTLPERGVVEQPEMVFFFDEAHLLFKDIPTPLLDKIEQTVRLIRSKGVGVFMISQSPADIPDTVLAQLGNRIQHRLQAYTPKEQKAVKAAAQSFRANPAFDTVAAISELATGEALVSLLDEKGVPGIVERANILPPQSSMEAAPREEMTRRIKNSPLCYKYDQAEDYESAYELIEADNQASAKAAEEARIAAEEAKKAEAEAKELAKQKAKEEAAAQKAAEKAELAAQRAAEKEEAAARRAAEKEADRRKKQVDRFVGNAVGTVGRELGKQVLKGIFGGKKK